MDISVYVTDGFSVLEEYNSLIKPDKKIHRYVSKLTGITEEMLKDAPSFSQEADTIAQITEGKVLVAHNAAFDFGMLRAEYNRIQHRFSRQILCTVEASRSLLPGLKSYSLGNLSNTLNIAIENRHRAQGDALATVKILMHLMDTCGSACLQKFIRRS